MSAALVGIVGWILVQLAIGFDVGRRIQTEDDYLVAGRSLGYPLAIATIFATWFGAETCIGAAGEAASNGLSGNVADPFGYAFCLVGMGLFFARALWRKKLRTMADLYRERYGTGVERLAVLMMVPTSVLWAAAQIRAFGQVLAAASPLEVHVTIGIAAAVVVAYTMFGGLLADSITDFVQGGALLVGLCVLGVAVWTSDAAAHVQLSAERLSLATEGGLMATAEAWAVPVVGSIVAQELVARVIAAKNPDIAARSSVLAGVIYLLVGLIPVSIGLAAPQLLGTFDDPEQVLVLAAERFLPTALYVVFTGALVSAILSTVDSALLVAGSLLGHNVVAPMLGVQDERRRVRIDRLAVAGFGVVAWIMAESSERVYELVEMASGLGTSGLFVLVVASLVPGSPGGKIAATATMLTGLGVYVAGEIFGLFETPYVWSLLASIGVYLAIGAFERRDPALPEPVAAA